MSNDKEIFVKGIENLRAVGRKEQLSFKSSIKVLFFYLYLCLKAKYNKTDGSVFFIVGAPEARKPDPTNGACKRIYARRFSNDNKELKEWPSLSSCLHLFERIGLLLKSFFTVPHGGHYLGRWFEFQLLKKTIEKQQIEHVSSFGHYDEFTYWASELCQRLAIPFEMFQHGVVIDSINIPNKVFCSRIHVFNFYSETVFRDRIVKNNDCQYSIDGLRCSVVFEKIKKQEGLFYIGVIDQMDSDWTAKVSNSIKRLKNCVPIVMDHPLRAEKCFTNDEKVIETQKKYINIDILIVNYSTLVLDYLAYGFNKPIFCTNKEACSSYFGDYSFRCVSEEGIEEAINDVLGTEVISSDYSE